MRFAVSRRPDPVIDLSPLIDVVFQLVLFFMVSTTFVQAPGFQVDLPRSSAQTVISEKTDVNVWITADGAVHLDEAPVTLESLKQTLRSKARVDPNTMVIIKADTGVPHGRVVGVMDLARAEGLHKLAIATDPGGAEEDGR